MDFYTYSFLRDHHEKHWIINGPNTIGMGGVYLFEGQLFFYYGEWSMKEPVLKDCYTIERFLATFENSDDEGIKEIIKSILHLR